MENENPPPTNNPHILPALRARVVQELNKLQTISAYIDSRLESINRFLNDLDDDSDDGVVLNELEEYGKMQVSSKKRENWTLNKALERKDVINGYFYKRIIYKKLSAYDLELL
ncbi:hypothetical protein Tco_0590928 [Tanacetum coccineum]